MQKCIRVHSYSGSLLALISPKRKQIPKILLIFVTNFGFLLFRKLVVEKKREMACQDTHIHDFYLSNPGIIVCNGRQSMFSEVMVKFQVIIYYFQGVYNIKDGVKENSKGVTRIRKRSTSQLLCW